MDEPLQRWLDAVDERWRQIGLSPLVRGRLRRDLERDVGDALRTGADTDDLIATDPKDFADQVAQAQGHSDAPVAGGQPSTKSVTITALAGALGGAAVVWFVVWPVLTRAVPTASDTTFIAVGYLLGATVVLLGSVAALRRRFGADAAIAQVVLPTLTGLIVGGLVGLPATLLISRALAYPTDPVLVLLEAIPIIGCASGGIYLARRLVARNEAAWPAQ
jgi:hypothetical protein